MKYNFEKIGKRVKEERKAKNWTQKKLMEKLSPYCPLGRNTLSDIENGICSNISLTLFSTLCKEEFLIATWDICFASMTKSTISPPT